MNFLLDDSATFTIGDAVQVDTDGLLVRATASEEVLGVLVGIVSDNDINVFSLDSGSAPIAGSTLTGDDTITTSATNSADATRSVNGKVVLDPAGSLLWYNDSSGTLAQTNLCQFFDNDADADQIDQTTGDDSTGQWQLMELDPDGDSDVSKGLFRIAENQNHPYSQD
jgi:hypothetical protein